MCDLQKEKGRPARRPNPKTERMNNLMNNLITINHKEQRVLTTQQLAEVYETDAKVITNNFSRNKERYEEDKHYFSVEGEDLKGFKTRHQFEGSLKINKLYLWTEKGALLHAKSLGTDKAWEVYDLLVETYFRAKEQAKQVPQSPMEFIAMMAQQALDQEKKITAVEGTIQTIKDALLPADTAWKADVNKKINRVVMALGNDKNAHLQVRHESYETLERRAGAKLDRRVINLQDRLRRNGATEAAIRGANKLDVIEQDQKLKEIYTSVIQQLVIKYC